MSYGASTDHFGIADTNWKLQSSSKDPISSNATGQDENGDNACETVYDTAFAYTASYRYCGTGDTSGNVVFGTRILGADTTNSKLLTSVGVTTSNTERPMMTVNGEDLFGTPSHTYTLTMPTVTAAKTAQGMGFTADTVTNLLSSTWTAAAQTSYAQDSDGQRVISDVYQGRIEASGELMSCTGTPGAAADTGYTLNGPVSNSQSNTGYETATVNVFQNLLADT